MKNLQYILWILGLSLVLFVSCEDYLTKEIPFDDIGFEPEMAISAKISSLKDSLFISVSKNNNYADADRAEFIMIDDVELKLSIVGGQSFSAVPMPNTVSENIRSNYNYLIIFNNEELSGKSFILEASHAEYPDARSEIFLPESSQVLETTFEKEAITKVEFGYPTIYDKVTLRVVDLEGTNNYYAFVIKTRPHQDTFIQEYGGTIDTFIWENPGQAYDISSDDPNATSLGNFSTVILFDDKNFDGEDYTFELLFAPWGGSNYQNNLVVEYRNISQDEFFFKQSFQKYINSQDFGIFSEPVTLYSNIEGGLGIFSGEDVFDIDVN